MDLPEVVKIVDSFKDKKICIIGDLMLDKYIYGDVERISPEAPIPVVKISSESFSPGGAGNVANNVASLGGSAFIVGVIGQDSSGENLLLAFKERNINTEGIIIDTTKKTIEKTRVIARGQHMIRIDSENDTYIDKKHEKKIFEYINTHLNKFDCIVISDYAKGTLTGALTRKIIDFSNKHKIPVIVDPKPQHASFYKNAFILTPNQKEAEQISGVTKDIIKMGKKIKKQLNCNVLITQGAQGMTLFEGHKTQHFPAKAKEVFDVAGAGDTVVAGIALSLACGAPLKIAATIANHAAGIVVGKVGTATTSIEELKTDILENGIDQ